MQKRIPYRASVRCQEEMNKTYLITINTTIWSVLLFLLGEGCSHLAQHTQRANKLRLQVKSPSQSIRMFCVFFPILFLIPLKIYEQRSLFSISMVFSLMI